jgi:predicted NAD/FAD-binding protein
MRYPLFAAILVVSLATAGSVSAQELIGVSGFTATHGMLSGSGRPWAAAHPSVIAAMNMSIADFNAHATADNGISE